MAPLEVGLNPEQEATLVINHALVAAHIHKAVMVSNRKKGEGQRSSLFYFPWQFQLGTGHPGDPGDHAHLHVAVELKQGHEAMRVSVHVQVVQVTWKQKPAQVSRVIR